MVIFSLNKLFDNTNSTSVSRLKEALLTFKCSKDADVEAFLHINAIQYEITHRARTYLCSCVDRFEILGYFAIAIRDLEITPAVSKNLKKRLAYGFTNMNHVPAYLIGQVAKCDTCTDKIGKLLIDSSIEYIKKSRDYVGGRVVYLDCKEVLCAYYEKLGFNYLQDNDDLKQMIQTI